MSLNLFSYKNFSFDFDLSSKNNFSNYLLCNGDGISRDIQKTGYYDEMYINICSHFIQPNTVVLDIGANLGSWIVEESKLHPTCRFIAFEPQKMTFYQLCGNLFINNCKNTETFPCALTSDSNIKKMLFQIHHPSNNGGSRLKCEAQRAPIHCVEEIMVPSATLDSFNINNISFIKIDVEGHELDVLKGSLETLKNNDYPPIGYECWDDFWAINIKIELQSFLDKLGYVSILIYPSSYLAYHKKHLIFNSKVSTDDKLILEEVNKVDKTAIVASFPDNEKYVVKKI
jgi:FkbM family methyltransferase